MFCSFYSPDFLENCGLHYVFCSFFSPDFLKTYRRILAAPDVELPYSSKSREHALFLNGFLANIDELTARLLDQVIEYRGR